MAKLMDCDPGLRRRFPNTLHLPDYDACELALIAAKTARERFKMHMAEGCKRTVAAIIDKHHAKEVRHHNASLAITMVENSVVALAERIGEAAVVTDKDLHTLLPVDFSVS